MLRNVENRAKEENLDWIGSSFQANYDVVKFWTKNGYIPVYLASKKNESLGGYSVIVIKPISDTARKIVDSLSLLLKDKLLRTSHQVYFNMDPE